MNPAALLALALGVLPNGPGFLTAIGVLAEGAVWPGLVAVYNYAWFVGFLLLGGIYLLLMRRQTAAWSAPRVADAVVQPAPSLVQ